MGSGLSQKYKSSLSTHHRRGPSSDGKVADEHLNASHPPGQTRLQNRQPSVIDKKRYEALYNRYANLFDFAPNGYVVFDRFDIILEANLTAAILFNEPRNDLPGKSICQFIQGKDQKLLHLLKQDCLNDSQPHTGSITLTEQDGRQRPVQIQLQRLPCDTSPDYEFRAAILDLSEQTRISNELQFQHRCLEVSVNASDIQSLLDAYLRQIQSYAGCSAVGIRLKDSDNRIPYQAYSGFSRQFYEKESPLSLQNDQCMCIEVVKGRTDPSKPFYTDFGSFYVNSTTGFQASVAPEIRNSTRNACNAAGYESVALIPITAGKSITGLIHVADRHEGRLPLALVEALEQAAMRLGLALQHLRLQERLSEAAINLRDLSSHLIIAKEEEQRRIAMELHDQTGQELNVLKLRLKEIQNGLRKDQKSLNAMCGKTLTFCDHIIEDVRRMIRGLNPATLEALGLSAALNQMTREYAKHCPISIETRIDPLKKIKGRELQSGLFHLVQEALSNAVKHANATRIAVTAIDTSDFLRIAIEDNGAGFDSTNALRAGDTKRMGLAAMRLRARMIGASLYIQSQIGEGTRITIDLPVGMATEVQ